MNWATGNWAPLVRITEPDETKRWSKFCEDRPGVYRLIALDGVTPELMPASITRACGTDATGTLYIGMATSLPGRLGVLVRTHHPDYPDGRGHPKLHPPLAKRFPPEKLAITWEYAEAANDRERQLMDLYINAFGDRPPLNPQGGVLERGLA